MQRRVDLLWMRLVERTVHTDRGPEPGGTLVVTQAVQDGPEGGGHQVGGTEGDDGAYVLDRNTVIVRWLHSQAG